MPLKGGFGCLELVLYDIRLGSEGLDFCHKEPAKGLELVLYGIRELA